MTQIKEMVSIEIIKAGIAWLISMLNPASAFVKACKMIYDVVMFFVEKADQIKEFVDSHPRLGRVDRRRRRRRGRRATSRRRSAKMVPVLIGFLASLLGLGGISGKIKKISRRSRSRSTRSSTGSSARRSRSARRPSRSARSSCRQGQGQGQEGRRQGKKKLGIKEKTPEQIEPRRRQRARHRAESSRGRPVARPCSGSSHGRARYRACRAANLSTGEKWSVSSDRQRTTSRHSQGALDERQARIRSAASLAAQIDRRSQAARSRASCSDRHGVRPTLGDAVDRTPTQGRSSDTELRCLRTRVGAGSGERSIESRARDRRLVEREHGAIH